MLWIINFQLHVRKLHRSMELIFPHIWKFISSFQLHRIFDGGRIGHCMRSRSFLNIYLSGSGLYFPISVVEGLFLRARPNFCR